MDDLLWDILCPWALCVLTRFVELVLHQWITRCLYEERLSIAADEDALSDLPVPNLEDVRRDVAEAPNVWRRVKGTSEEDILGQLLAKAPPGQRLQDLLPDLYAYSTRACCDEIPSDVVDQCLRALEIQLWSREPSPSLHRLTHLYLRLGALYMRPDVDMPICTVVCMDNLCKCIPRVYPTWEVSALPPKIILRYATALTRTASDDDKAERLLNLFLASDDHLATDVDGRVKAQLHLARVLRRKGRVQEAASIESELVRWFKQNPRRFHQSELKSLFPPDSVKYPMDPVLAALSGVRWLDSRQSKTDEPRDNACVQCNTNDPCVTLKRCGSCDEALYCSQKCQDENSPVHKELCQWSAERSTRMEAIMKDGDPSNVVGEKFGEWVIWDTKTHPHVAMHALGLHRDRTRGRTHVFIREVEHDSTADTVTKMFVTTRCGVFRLEDVHNTVEKSLGLGQAKGKLLRNSLHRYESQDSSNLAPILEVVTCRQAGPAFICRAMPCAEADKIPYDPNWMQKVNRDGQEAPKKITQWDGAKNAEHDF